jgi:transposase
MNSLAPSPSKADTALLNSPASGLTVKEVAHRYRVGEDKVRAWIRRGELRAINTATITCARPRFVVPPEALSEFEQRRTIAPPNPQRKRRRAAHQIDFYPD